MLIFRKLGSLALRQLAGDRAKDLLLLVENHLTDHSQRLTEALARANERAWKTIEIALGGSGSGTGSPRPRTRPCASRSRRSSRRRAGGRSRLPAACLKELRQAQDNQHLTTTGAFEPESARRGRQPVRPVRRSRGAAGRRMRGGEEIARELKRLGYRHPRPVAGGDAHAGPALAGDGRPVLLPPGRRCR